jgi:RNA polymerase sigma factor (sigma-70 family)
MTEAQLAAHTEEAPSTVSRLLSDERLARRAASGDERALETIYRRYHQDLYRFCLAMTGDAQDAQEALQNTMVKVLRALPGERRRIKLKPWLYRIARNEAVEVLRRRRDNEELEVDVPTVGSVAETAETRERLRALLDDLEQLPQRQRAVLLLRELSGCDFEEIGDAFGTSAAVARQTLYEARLGLRELEEGRERRCADVRRELSDGDGRALRRRRTRAHLRDCPDCRAFQEAIDEREKTLAGIAPLPIAASAGMLQAVLGGQASAAGATGSGGVAAAIGVGAGETLATSAALKSVATIAVAVVAVTAADRTGIVDVPITGKDGPAAEGESRSAESPPEGQRGATAGAKTERDDAVGAGAAGGAAGGERRSPGDGEEGAGANASEQSDTAPGGRPDSEAGHQSSRAGLSPPSGGYGKSAADRGGRPEGAPDAARKGQETAASHKPSDTPGPPPAPGDPGPPDKPDPGPPPDAGSPPPQGRIPPAPPVKEGPSAKAAQPTPVEPPAPGGKEKAAPAGGPPQS